MPRILHNALTAVKVSKVSEPGYYADGNGLYLSVSDTGAKSWIWRGTVRGRRRELGLGSTSLYSLAEAREAARDYRKAAREGRDPKEERDAARRRELTFQEAAQRFWKDTVAPAKSEKDARLWQSMMAAYALPRIGGLPVARIGPDDILAVLKPIWMEKPETARRVLARMRHVFDWAVVGGFRTEANPTASVRAALPRQPNAKGHFAALAYPELPDLMRTLERTKGMGALALRFTILTAVRSGETRGATWGEVDLEKAAWGIPPERMKAQNGHRVPLSDPVLDILRHVEPLPDTLVFPSSKVGRPLSDMTLSAVLRRLGVDATVHGFRSTFRDWAEEQTDFAHEIKEAALAHRVSNAVERAYRRTDLFDRRRELMNAWAAFCLGGAS
ncbi:MAG: tyrosine-type recombinase/integrase [Paracoccaceae bacterium]